MSNLGFKKENIEMVYPSHCVSDEVKKKFAEELSSTELRSGDIMSF